MQRSARMKREIEMMSESPPPGISCWPKEDCLDQLEAQIVGGDDTPYNGGVFKLEIQIPERYPFEPPKVKYLTPIYHPNIDTAGRICLDALKMPPSGSWKPCLNISTILTSLQLLMAEPNPDDPLMTDIATEFKLKRPVFTEKASEWTKKYAMGNNSTADKSSTSKAHLNKSAASSDSSDTSDSEEENEKTSKNQFLGNKNKRSASGVLQENVKVVRQY